jgi:hypothetical protein
MKNYDYSLVIMVAALAFYSSNAFSPINTPGLAISAFISP